MWENSKVGSIGDIGCFSFFPTKNLGAAGDGGAVTTSDQKIAKKIRELAVHGSPVRYHHTQIGYNSRLDTIQAAILNIKIKYISKTTDEVVKTILTQPNSFDIVDSEYFSMPKLVPSGSLLGMDTNRIKEWSNVVTAFTEGKVNGKTIGDQGTAPKKVLYLKGPKSKEFTSEPSRYVTLIPKVYNAAPLGIRPDLIKRPISTWA